MLPKCIHIPSSGASTKTVDSPPPPLHPTNLNFKMLPRGPSRPSVPDPIVSQPPPGTHISPSGASTKTVDSPPPPLHPTNLNFKMLPRGPSRPLVPDPIVSQPPPPPSSLEN
ncbi:hypothetical protein TSUD_12190 [Trifolium subterraneum]|uniref:Uncharacterized protein n=1 Tax=Trifolium subterraneum TaxID=3900 RepID=A0A2Z6MCS9_TRISU|nr:hypothetical protein TSUD_12190 [Trifolium subterraneum]